MRSTWRAAIWSMRRAARFARSPFHPDTLTTRGTPVAVIADVVTVAGLGVDAVVAGDGTLAYVRGSAQGGGRSGLSSGLIGRTRDADPRAAARLCLSANQSRRRPPGGLMRQVRGTTCVCGTSSG